jgi:hypothetical protein
LPIILASFQLGRGNGLVAALAAIVLYHIANLSHFTASYTDTDVVQTVLFLVVAIVTAKLASDRARLHELAVTDDLTGLHNLRSFQAHLAGMVRACRESRAPLAMLVADVDRLKTISDGRGHSPVPRQFGWLVIRLRHIYRPTLWRQVWWRRVRRRPCQLRFKACRLVAEDLRRAVQLLEPVLAGVPFPWIACHRRRTRQPRRWAGSTAAASDEFARRICSRRSKALARSSRAEIGWNR